MGPVIWPQNRLWWGRGYERPAAHTQQKLTQVPPPLPVGGIHLCTAAAIKNFSSYVRLAFCCMKGRRGVNYFSFLPKERGSSTSTFGFAWYMGEQTTLILFWYFFLHYYPDSTNSRVKELLSKPWLKFWVVAKEYILPALLINLMIEDYVQNLANKRR